VDLGQSDGNRTRGRRWLGRRRWAVGSSARRMASSPMRAVPRAAGSIRG